MRRFERGSPHVLFVSTQNLWGETDEPQRAPGRTLKGYIDAGFRVSVISCCKTNERFREICPDGTFVTVFDKNAIAKRRHAVRVFYFACLFPLLAIKAFWQKFRGKDLALIYGYEVYGVIAAAAIGLFSRAPRLSRFQGTVLAPLLQPGVPLRRKAAKLDHLLAYALPARFAIMTDDGTFGDKVLQLVNPVLASKSVFWRNGSNVVEPKIGFDVRRVLNLRSDALLVVTASRLASWKRVDRAIKTFSQAPRDERSFLVILGDGPERQNLQALAASRGVADRVIFAGQVAQELVPNFLAQADVFISFYDLSNLGNPIFEAMRSGAAIMTLDVGDTSSVIKDAQNGVLLREWDEQQSSAALGRLLEDSAERRRLGDAAREYARMNFWTWERRIAAEVELVSKIIDEKAAAP